MLMSFLGMAFGGYVHRIPAMMEHVDKRFAAGEGLSIVLPKDWGGWWVAEEMIGLVTLPRNRLVVGSFLFFLASCLL